jgi:hypothetical protein
MPCIVKAIGERVGMTPIAWKENKDQLIIVFEQGPKLTFERHIEAEPEPVPETPKPARKPRKTKK